MPDEVVTVTNVNYAEKYSPVVDVAFSKGAFTAPAVNTALDWIGTRAVNVYSVKSAEMVDYKDEGDNRYGTPTEIETALQVMEVTQDRAFTKSLDYAKYDDQLFVTATADYLVQQLREVVIPEIDKYRLAKIIAGAGNVTPITPINEGNAYKALLQGKEALTNALAPDEQRIAFVTPEYGTLLMMDDKFVKTGDTSQNMQIRGYIGRQGSLAGGITLIEVPKQYFPAGVAFVITNQIATVVANKLTFYQALLNPRGINGWVLEGRFRYDAFVFNNKKDAIYVHKTA